jgi:hypothetical protein
MPVKTLQGAQSTGGGAQQLLPDRGRGVKRTVIIHVYNAANVTAFIAHTATALRETLTQSDPSFGTQSGIPIGKNGAATPFTCLDWEGEMWGTGNVDSVQIFIEEGYA